MAVFRFSTVFRGSDAGAAGGGRGARLRIAGTALTLAVSLACVPVQASGLPSGATVASQPASASSGCLLAPTCGDVAAATAPVLLAQNWRNGNRNGGNRNVNRGNRNQNLNRGNRNRNNNNRPRRGNNNNVGAGIAAGIAAGIIGGIISNSARDDGPRRHRGGRHNAHVDWCLDRYRSYNPRTDTFRTYGGRDRRCRSPYN